jgi:hypothetical protein
MSIGAMKQALEALEQVKPLYDRHHAIVALRQAIEQAEKREWAGLTDEELEPLCKEWRIIFGSWTQDFARAIEAKLKEKNT